MYNNLYNKAVFVKSGWINGQMNIYTTYICTKDTAWYNLTNKSTSFRMITLPYKKKENVLFPNNTIYHHYYVLLGYQFVIKIQKSR